jgi:hypothetical protein
MEHWSVAMNRGAVFFVAGFCTVACAHPTDASSEGCSTNLEGPSTPASHEQDGCVLVSGQPTTVNLLDLRGRVVQGRDLALPSVMQSGVKVNANLEVLDSGEVVVRLDRNAGAHPLNSPQGHEPRPTIDADIQSDDTARVGRPTFETTPWHQA